MLDLLLPLLTTFQTGFKIQICNLVGSNFLTANFWAAYDWGREFQILFSPVSNIIDDDGYKW